MLRIPAELEKGHKDRLLPIVPDFAQFLLETPEHKRLGFVFNPIGKNGFQLKEDRVMKLIVQLGREANVKVATAASTGKIKYASAQDFRRAFGSRWAVKVMPPILKELMRHESIDTTMKYYVGRNAQSTAKILWDMEGKTGLGNILGKSRPKPAQNHDEQNDGSSLSEKTL